MSTLSHKYHVSMKLMEGKIIYKHNFAQCKNAFNRDALYILLDNIIECLYHSEELYTFIAFIKFIHVCVCIVDLLVKMFVKNMQIQHKCICMCVYVCKHLDRKSQ